jgi:ABC-2 type transport system permease protein
MLRVYWLMKMQSFKAQLEYPANFFLTLVSVSLSGFAEIAAIMLLTAAFQTIGGWNFWQVGFMAGLWRLAHSLNLALFLGIWDHQDLVRDGGYDRLLIRPAHPMLQILASGFHLEAIADLLPALTLLWLSVPHVQVSWTPGNLLFLAAVVLSGAVIEASVALFLATFDFWDPQTSKLWVMEALLLPTARYPLSIYGPVLATFLTFVFPFGFIAYYPAQHFLQIGAQSGLLPYLSPLVALITASLALTFWLFGLRHYQSTGS